MYRKCPKCGHERTIADSAPQTACPACGLVFEKWLRRRLRPPVASAPALPEPQGETLMERAQRLLLYVEAPVDPVGLYGRAAVYVLLFIWGWQFILMDHAAVEAGGTAIGQSFMHRVNLVFHEAGHVIFMPFGRFMSVLGGTLGQWLMPAIVAGVFLFKTRDTFGASVGLWWLGQSFMDAAPYVHDARAGRLLLLGGFTGQDSPGSHDWRNILGDLGWLEYDHAIAALVDGMGVVLMLTAFAWGGYVLYLQYLNRDTRYR
jgi:hypothetical protein